MPLLLLLGLLPSLLVGPLLIQPLAFLLLLLLDPLPLLILLPVHVLQLLLMLLLELRIPVRRRVRRPGCRRPIVTRRTIIVRRAVGLHIRRRCVRPLYGRRAIRLIRLHISGPFRVRRLRSRPVIRIGWPRGW